jgi:hypothetical protein
MPPTAAQTAAAAVAEDLRQRRRRLVQEIAEGRVDLADVATGDDAAAIKLISLAEAVPDVGKVRSRRVLDLLGLRHGTRWGELAPTTAESVVAALRQVATDDGASPTTGT